ncbi:acyl carrier protein [Microbispora hainanensis]|uniref:Acyl carrier protein n=1 Tax=Microbispora hainanensis TaxID=568844 RepID=A0A544Z2N6_9ACTN|nr:acyl carrier protein [Microbispora hainanensis]TQS23320.1 acyl carrier protein [Microbispora hainanensis]
MSQFTIQDLRRIMREAAGEDASVDLDGEIHDTSFEDLRYDSLAVLEITVRVERELGIKLGDGETDKTQTPREFLAMVDARLTQAA